MYNKNLLFKFSFNYYAIISWTKSILNVFERFICVTMVYLTLGQRLSSHLLSHRQSDSVQFAIGSSWVFFSHLCLAIPSNILLIVRLPKHYCTFKWSTSLQKPSIRFTHIYHIRGQCANFLRCGIGTALRMVRGLFFRSSSSSELRENCVIPMCGWVIACVQYLYCVYTKR